MLHVCNVLAICLCLLQAEAAEGTAMGAGTPGCLLGVHRRMLFLQLQETFEGLCGAAVFWLAVLWELLWELRPR